MTLFLRYLFSIVFIALSFSYNLYADAGEDSDNESDETLWHLQSEDPNQTKPLVDVPNLDAEQALLFDVTTGTFLYVNDADSAMKPSSMSKLMTLYILFDHIKKDIVRLDDRFLVSEKAWRKGGSKMFIEVGKRVKVEDLIRGIVVQSGNDACIVVAENLAINEEAFADMMNETAKTIGLKDSTFRNATGWPDPEQFVTSRDLAILAYRLMTDFPEYYHYFSETKFTYNKIAQYNRNPLVGKFKGCDGLKTGHTEEAGYGLVASAERDGRRLVLVMNGMQSKHKRKSETAKLMEWGFRQFNATTLLEKGKTIALLPVWRGTEDSISVHLSKDVYLPVPKKTGDEIRAKIIFTGPIPAPIVAHQQIATLQFTIGERVFQYPLFASKSVDEIGFFGKIWWNMGYLMGIWE